MDETSGRDERRFPNTTKFLNEPRGRGERNYLMDEPRDRGERRFPNTTKFLDETSGRDERRLFDATELRFFKVLTNCKQLKMWDTEGKKHATDGNGPMKIKRL